VQGSFLVLFPDMAVKKKKKSPARGKSGFFRKVIIAAIVITIGSSLGGAWLSWNYLWRSNVKSSPDAGAMYLYIKTGSKFEEVMAGLRQSGMLKNEAAFEWVARWKGYPDKVKPGRYLIKSSMGNNELVNLLKSGRQEPVKLVLNTFRQIPELAGFVSGKLEADSAALVAVFENEERLRALSLPAAGGLSVIIPNTYEFWWNTSAENFFEKMAKEYRKFWNGSRMTRLKKKGINAAQASVIASIVQQETNYKPEMPLVASVYLNRLDKGMKLQADPTVVYAIGDFSIRRVLKTYLDYDSPYNTYRYAGLPPGPICTPEIHAIDAVLNAPDNDLIYFCAKEDFSGRHNFASNAKDHERNAVAYRKALSKRKIFK
jgi:UPF0755 protein